VQSLDAHHDRRQRGRDLRVTHVADVRRALRIQIVYFGVKRALHLRGGATKADRQTIFGYFGDRKSVPCQPTGYGRNVGLRWPEVRANLIRRQPVMKVGRTRVVLAGDELVESRLLLRVAVQHQNQVGHREVGAHAPQIVLRIRKRVRVALEGYEIALVDPVDDPYLGCELLRSQCG